MSEVKVNKISPRTACGTVTLGDSGDTFTLPSGATMTVASGGTITNSGTASGFGATGETSWDTTVKTTGTFTATAGVGYFLNTTGGIITVNLPVGAAGSSVAIVDYAGTWDTNAVTISPNGSEYIGGINADAILNTEGQSVTFVYIDGTQGWVNVLDSTSNVTGNPYMVATGGCITCSGNYKVHKFTGPGTFAVTTCAISPTYRKVDYIVSAGGGGGGIADRSGGGGGGGFRESHCATTSGPYTASPIASATSICVSGPGGPYPIAVGSGGTVVAPASTGSNKGNDSSFSTITSTGGGQGGSYDTPNNAANGGSGGGGAIQGNGGCGNDPSVSPAQGTDGGNGPGSTAGPDPGNGGGGATVAGGDYPSPGAGGAGATTELSGASTAYSGGGGGGACGGTNWPGGTGGGGTGGKNSGCTNAIAGGVNTSGGGGGNGPSSQATGTGGSGVVIIRYRFQ